LKKFLPLCGELGHEYVHPHQARIPHGDIRAEQGRPRKKKQTQVIRYNNGTIEKPQNRVQKSQADDCEKAGSYNKFLNAAIHTVNLLKHYSSLAQSKSLALAGKKAGVRPQAKRRVYAQNGLFNKSGLVSSTAGRSRL
jgi:hypothetical protein